MSLKFFTAILNSKLFQFVYINSLVTNKNSTPQLKKVDLDKLPIYFINFTNKVEKEIHDKIARFVDKITIANLEIGNTKLQSDIDILKREVLYIDKQINENIYKLYNLTDKEIEIIEK
jgi:hypothetical protein